MTKKCYECATDLPDDVPFCGNCGQKQPENLGEYDLPENVRKYISKAIELVATADFEINSDLLSKLRKQYKVTREVHDKVAPKFFCAPAISIFFDKNSSKEGAVGGECLFRFKAENNSNSPIKVTINWDDPETPDNLDLHLASKPIGPNSSECLEGSHVLMRPGTKTIVSRAIITWVIEDEEQNYEISSFKYSLKEKESAPQTVVTNYEYKVEARIISETQIGGGKEPEVIDLEKRKEDKAEPDWEKLTLTRKLTESELRLEDILPRATNILQTNSPEALKNSASSQPSAPKSLTRPPAAVLPIPTNKPAPEVARSLFKQKRYEEAEPFFRDALAICEEVLGEEHLDTATALHELAYDLFWLDKNDEAEYLCIRALTCRENQLGSEHPDTADTMDLLASIYRDTGQLDSAEDLARHALKIRKHLLGATSLGTLESMVTLADIYYEQGNYEDAKSLYGKALDVYENHFPTQYEKCYAVMGLASALSKLGEHERAEPLFRRNLRLAEEDADPGWEANSAWELAENLTEQYFYDEAQSLYRRALSIWEALYGPDDDFFLANTLKFADFLEKCLGESEAAGKLYVHCASRLEETLGGDNPATQECLMSFALFLRTHGKYQESEKVFKKLLEIKQRGGGENELDMAMCRVEMAKLLKLWGKYKESESQFSKALPIMIKQLGESAEETREVKEQLEAFKFL